MAAFKTGVDWTLLQVTFVVITLTIGWAFKRKKTMAWDRAQWNHVSVLRNVKSLEVKMVAYILFCIFNLEVNLVNLEYMFINCFLYMYVWPLVLSTCNQCKAFPPATPGERRVVPCGMSLLLWVPGVTFQEDLPWLDGLTKTCPHSTTRL